MKKLLFYFFALSIIFSVSCKKDPIVVEKGTLQSATYNHTAKTFTLTYSSGQTETVNATVDNSVTPPKASATLTDGTVVSIADASASGEATITTTQQINDYKYVNGWIYENMEFYYLWNDKLSKTPNYSLHPKDFFNSILYKYNATTNPDGDQFSWIQEGYVDLLNSLGGITSGEIGLEYKWIRIAEGRPEVAMEVLYPKKGSDAYSKGIKRGEWILAVNGTTINDTNYKTILSGTGAKTLSRIAWEYNTETKKYVSKSLPDLTIQMHSKFAEDPLYLDSVYTLDSKKIGYLAYNFFAKDKGDGTGDYDKQLMNTLANLRAKGINEMVLDLRYNGGGAVSTAIALASALVKDRAENKLLISAQYNQLLTSVLQREYGDGFFKDYFINQIDTAVTDENGKVIKLNKVADIPTLNLPRLYVLTSGWTASASELIINGLKPYMDVVLIGTKTYGKNFGSISIYEKNDSKNKWGMQPIIVKYYNSAGESDYTAGFTPNHDIDESNYLLYDFGDINDPLLGKAISLITGQTRSTRSAASTPFRSSQVDNNATLKMQDKTRFEMYDDVRGEAIKNLMRK